MKLETNRLILRSIIPDDKNDIFEYRSDTETNKYQGWIPETVADVESFIGKISKQINEPGTWYQFVILEKTSQKIIGDLGIHFFDLDNNQVEIGCTL
jgi:RimJ/RimL family protein N-acetyltransferase